MWKSAGRASFTLAFALQLRKKQGKTSARVRNLNQVKKNLSKSTVYILPKHSGVRISNVGPITG